MLYGCAVAERPFIVAIDGPAGAGKSTIARGVAEALGFTRVDTGAIYRSVTLAALERGLKSEAELERMIPQLQLEFRPQSIHCDGVDVTHRIRTPEVSEATSRFSAYPAVRAALLGLQRDLAVACDEGAVLEGRDIGTVVFPEADLKVFLTASAEERARRRRAEMLEKGENARYDDILASIQSRDERDTQRAVAPLRQADDAVGIDSTKMTVAEVVETIAQLVRERRASR